MISERNEKCKFDVRIINDEQKTLVKVKAKNKASILTALSTFVNALKEEGHIEEDEIEYAFNLGLGKNSIIPDMKRVNLDEFKKILEEFEKGE